MLRGRTQRANKAKPTQKVKAPTARTAPLVAKGMTRRPTFSRAQQPPPLRDASPSSQQPNATKEGQGRANRERNDKLVKTTD